MVGGSAQRCVAESPNSPAGPLSERAVTIVLPVARWPIACQNCFTSIVAGRSDISFTAGDPTPDGAFIFLNLRRQRARIKAKLHTYAR